MKYGAVFAFTLVIVATFSWATFGGVPVETQLERLYFLVPVNIILLFSIDWYRAKAFDDRIRKLEQAIREKEDEAPAAVNQKSR